VKENVFNVSSEQRNPYAIVRRWLKWEQMEIHAFYEAVQKKQELE